MAMHDLISPVTDSVILGLVDPAPWLVPIEDTSWDVAIIFDDLRDRGLLALDDAAATHLRGVVEMRSESLRAAHNAAFAVCRDPKYPSRRTPDFRASLDDAERLVDAALSLHKAAEIDLANILRDRGVSCSKSMADAWTSTLVIYVDGIPVLNY